jgi:hypothetical protein
LVVIAGVGARRQSRLTEDHLQIVILVGMIRSGWIERQGIEGSGVLDTVIDLPCQVIVRARTRPPVWIASTFKARLSGLDLAADFTPFRKSR